jgi:DNA repair protein RecO (recombination protein O)
MLEATDAVAQERQANIPLYRMLVGALGTLAEAPVPAVAVAFFWKLLSLEGFHPVLEACARCDGPVPEGGGATFDLMEGGVLCLSCAGPGAPVVRPGALAVVSRILGGGLRGVLAEPPGPALAEAESLAVRALEHHLERRLRSGAILLTTMAPHAPRI